MASEDFPLNKPNFLRITKLFTNHAENIIGTFFKEEKMLIQVQCSSNHIDIRPKLVNLLQDCAIHWNFSLATLHLGVHILDVFMSVYSVSELVEHQKLIGIICLLLAAKVEDIDENIPLLNEVLLNIDLSTDLGVDFRFQDTIDPKEMAKALHIFKPMYCQLEFLILKCLNFNVIRPTTVSFVNVFKGSVTSEDIKNGGGNTKLSLRCANEFLQCFLKIVITDIDFFNILPSKIAAAVIGATRKLLQIHNYWNVQLEQLTRYRLEEIRLLIVTLIEKHNASIHKTEQQDNTYDDVFKDSGYISPPSQSDTEEECIKTLKKRKLNRRSQAIFEDMSYLR